jgi:DNA-binding CsgD family transcriptional regulator
MTRDQISDHQKAGTITTRQAEILQLRARGYSQYEVARGLGVTRSTVKSLERNALEKIARSSQQEAA